MQLAEGVGKQRGSVSVSPSAQRSTPNSPVVTLQFRRKRLITGSCRTCCGLEGYGSKESGEGRATTSRYPSAGLGFISRLK